MADDMIRLESAEEVLEGRQALNRFFSGIQPRIARRGDRVNGSGEKIETLIMLFSGWLSREHRLSAQCRAILGVYIPGDIYGIIGLVEERHRTDIVALTDVSYLALPLGDVWRALKATPAISMYLLNQLDLDRRLVEEMAIGLGRATAEQRVATFLCDIYRRLRMRQLVNSRSFRFPLTQNHLADHLGITSIHVNRVLRALRERDILLLRRNVAVIRDPQALHSLCWKRPVRLSEAPIQRHAFFEDYGNA